MVDLEPLKLVKEFLGKDRMREMGFNIPADSKVSARTMLTALNKIIMNYHLHHNV